MPQIINTNIASLNTQRNLNTSQTGLSTALQRLSTGLRINSAKDDAAGLAISERFTSQIRGLNQAVRNANDGISLAQTAEGALGENGNILQRIRELAVQSANATNSASDRRALNSEVQQLLAEVQRNAQSTQFNGQNILDGSYTGAQFQIGANANQTILVNVGNSQTNALGSYQGLGATAVTGVALASGDLLINGVNVGASLSGSARDISSAINNVSSQTGVSSTATSSLTSANVLRRNQALQSGDLVINGVNVGAVAGSNSLATQGANIAAAINGVSNQTGVTATANATTGALSLSSTTGANIAITSTNAASANRLENASGLEVRGATATASTSTATFAGGALGTSSINVTTNVAAGDTVAIGGTTYTFVASGATGNQINVGGTAAATNDNIRARLTALAPPSVTVTQTGGAGTAVQVTSTLFTSTNTRHAISAITGTGVATVSNTAGSGAAIGDTVNVGGVTYEFTFPSGTAVGAGNVAVSLGTSNDDAAQLFRAAVGAQYTAGNTNIQASGASNVITLTSDLLGSGASNVTVTEPVSTGTAGFIVGAAPTAGTDGAYAALNGYGTLSLNSDRIFTITGNNFAAAGLGAATPTLNTIANIDISSVAGANSALQVVDGALLQVASLRGDLGAVQNRFESTVSNLSATSENLSAARSRIRDADFAAETAALTRLQILQQAGIAILSQANALPQQVLALLR